MSPTELHLQTVTAKKPASEAVSGLTEQHKMDNIHKSMPRRQMQISCITPVGTFCLLIQSSCLYKLPDPFLIPNYKSCPTNQARLLVCQVVSYTI